MVETYSYSADGKRQRKVTVGGTTNYVWDGENLLLETDASLVTQGQYTQFPGEWGGLMSQRRAGVSSFHAFDLQSNTRALVSAAGAVSDSYRYKAFGEEVAVTGTTTNPHRYGGAVGYQRDSATRQYVRARHLGVSTGRWISRDPLGFGGGDENLYRYVENNPTTYTDPSGLRIPRNIQGFWSCFWNLYGRGRASARDACKACKGIIPVPFDCGSAIFNPPVPRPPMRRPPVPRLPRKSLLCWLFGIGCNTYQEAGRAWMEKLISQLAPVSRTCESAEKALNQISWIATYFNCNDPEKVEEVEKATREFYERARSDNPLWEKQAECINWCQTVVDWGTGCAQLGDYEGVVKKALNDWCMGYCHRLKMS